jgi:hypothetical protein
MRFEVLKDGEIRQMQTPSYKLNQGEACFIELINGMQLVIRYAPKTKPIIFDSPLILGSSEFTGILAALIIAVMASLIVSLNRPKESKSEEEIQRVAQVIFTTPPVELIAKSDVTPPPPSVLVEEKKQTQEEKKKSLILEEIKAEKIAGEEAKNAKKVESMKTSGQAENIKAKDPNLKNKMFTSTKSGGAVKTGAANGANAQSKDPDPTNTGLLAAFGEGGARSKLDQVYSGSGELLGAGEKAKGVSGFNTDRSGDDLGAKMKDTGAGGNGTATQGIAGVGTKGRGTGMSGYGSGMGFGDKDRVQIAAGGGEENFTGSIDKEAVRRVVKSALSQFKACYEREYRQDTSLEGKLVITWEIHAQGVAKNARVIKDKSTINNTIVEECVRTRILALIFPEPPPGTAAEVTYPFVFKGQKL